MVLKEIEMRWGAFDFPIKAGTPVCAAGVEANDSAAIGIIPQAIKERPLMSKWLVMVGGVVNSYTLEYELSDAAKKAMSGIEFFDGYKVSPAPEMGKELPDYTAATQGKALFIDDTGKPAWESVPSELPTVTAEDNDKVLKVVEGAWTKAAGGGGVTFPTVTIDESQVVSMNPVKVQLSEAQYEIFNTGSVVNVEGVLGKITITKSRVNNNYIWYQTVRYDSDPDWINLYEFCIPIGNSTPTELTTAHAEKNEPLKVEFTQSGGTLTCTHDISDILYKLKWGNVVGFMGTGGAGANLVLKIGYEQSFVSPHAVSFYGIATIDGVVTITMISGVRNGNVDTWTLTTKQLT